MQDLFFSFHGRINRLKWWLGSIAAVFTVLILALLLTLILSSFGLEVSFGSDVENTPAGAVVVLLMLAASGYVLSALAIKRLNDRRRPHWLLALYWTPTAIGLLDSMTGVLQTSGMLGLLVNALLFAVTIWMLIELGFLKGEAGPNPYGPDPLARSDLQPA